MTPLRPRASGIYQIRCIPTGKIYVGSAVDLSKRRRDHINGLRRSNHENAYLQRAWNKYGEENFEFAVLEFVDASDLLRAEQAKKTYCGFINPEGQRVIINNLQEFCQKFGLSLSHMCSLSRSKRKSHKGWTWREEEEHGR